MNQLKNLTLLKVLPYILLISGIIGLFASFVLTKDKFELLLNPHFVPNCNLNPVISCSNVMHSAQSSAFGFPNPWIGLAAFAVVVTVGVSILAGAQFKRWFWLLFEAGMLAGLAFAYWLLFESVYRIQALCPYCLAVDAVLITSSWYLTLYIAGQNFNQMPTPVRRILAFARKHHLEILITWLLIIIVLILQHFWYFYGKYF